mgnify:FL=1
MAIIGKIREKSGLLVGIVGLALLAFVLGDYQSMFGKSEGIYGIGLVKGEKVNAEVYSQLSAIEQETDRNQAANQQKQFGEKEIADANDKAWKFMVDSTLLNIEYQSLGINVTDKEFNAYLFATDGFNPIQNLAQYFTDSLTGAVSEKSTIAGRQKLQAEITKLKASKEPGAKKQWEDFKKGITDQRKQEKYNDLIEQGVYVTSLEARNEYESKNVKKNISFVQRAYSEISDLELKVKESEIKAFYEAHKSEAKYKNRTSSRDLKLFDVAINPSKLDSTNFSSEINKLKQGFSSSTNDSLFVLKESENKMYFGDKRATAVPQNHEKANRFMSYPPDYDTIFKRATIGEIVSYSMGDKYLVSKVIGFTPSKLKARHLLISTKESNEPNAAESKDPKFIAAKKKMADSLLMVINKDNFSDLVKKYTDDSESKDKGGLYDNFLEGELVKEFSDFCATKDIGQIGIVKTEYGFHIIEALGRDSSFFPVLATIQKSRKPSETSLSDIESKVDGVLYKIDNAISKIESENGKISKFEKIAKEENYFVRTITIDDNSPKIDYRSSINYSKAQTDLLRLAYGEENKVGSICSAPIFDKNKYIIAILANIKEKGEPKYEDVKERMEKDILIDKKAKKLISEMSKTKNLASLASLYKTSVIDTSVTFSAMNIGNFSEPEIIGSLFSLIKDGQTTLPLKGSMGVYVIKVNNTLKAPAVANNNAERDELLNRYKSNAMRLAIDGLEKAAEVVDNRALFFASIRL